MLIVSQVAACGRIRLSAERRAAADLGNIRSTIKIWQGAVGQRVCPSKAELEKHAYASTNDWKDPWGGQYEYACSGDVVIVRSAGPDRVYGTADDVTLH